MSRRSLTAAVTLSAVAGFAAILLGIRPPLLAQSDSSRAAYVPGEILIRFEPEASQPDRESIRAVFDGVKLHTFRSGAEHWVLGPTETVEQALTYLRSNVLIEYAEPNHILTADAADCDPASDGLCPTDPNFPEQWALRNLTQTGCTDDADIDATQAWEVTTGSGLVALIDRGADYNHPDLAANIWVNPLEIPDNLVDEDGCYQLNDVHGYDFENNDPDPYDAAITAHGTTMAGIIAARTDDLGICEGPSCPEEGVYRGIAGVSWHTKLMLVQGFNTVSMAAQSIDYVVCMDSRVQKVDAINASWGGFGYSQTLRNAIKAAGDRDILFVASAGNAGLNLDLPGNEKYPASYDLPNIITVASTNCNDGLATSNYGVVSVDIAAPGTNIRTTGGRGDPNQAYGWPLVSGTSPAAAHVSGVAALLRTLNPGFPGELIRKRIMDRGDYNSSTQGLTVTGERLNAYNAVVDQDIVAPAAISNLSATPGYTTITLNWTATADDGSDAGSGPATAYQIRYAAWPIQNLDDWLDATRVGNEPAPKNPGQAESFFLNGLQCNTIYDFAIRPFDEWGNGPMSVVTRKTLRALCQISYCASEEMRCTSNGSCGVSGCCNYTCAFDPTCIASDPCPPNACSCGGGW